MAPFALQSTMLAHLRSCAQAARKGEYARVVIKSNAMTDEVLMQALAEAGQAGVQIDLIVRGACMLPPQLPGVSDNIRVRSIIGRFLEHSRVFYFAWGDAQEHVYLQRGLDAPQYDAPCRAGLAGGRACAAPARD